MAMSLIGPDNPLGHPAPYWFLVLFKTLGFTLHILPMHLWYAGLPAMLLLRRHGGEHGRRTADRTLGAMPVAIAWGVNLGIVPLLFTQVAYYKVFYPATILMAWPWLAIIGLLTVAYYGVYAYALGLRAGRLAPWRVAAGWSAALLLIAIGWLFANAFSLMANVDGWRGIWNATGFAGAVLGTGLNTADPTLWPRWLMMLGLALTTTAAWVVFDAAVLGAGETPAWRAWASRFALRLHALGAAWFAVTGAWYVFGAMPETGRDALAAGGWRLVTALTAVAPGLVWLAILIVARRAARAAAGAGPTPGRAAGILTLGAQLVVLALNAVSRQVAQNGELAPHLDVAAGRVNTQLGPLVLFVALFVAGLGVVVWMLRQAAAAAAGRRRAGEEAR